MNQEDTTQTEQQAVEEEVQVDTQAEKPAFDKTRDARKAAIQSVQELVSKMRKGTKPNKQHLVTALSQLTSITTFLEELTTAIMSDMEVLAYHIGRLGSQSSSVAASVTALSAALEKKIGLSREECEAAYYELIQANQKIQEELAQTKTTEEPTGETDVKEEGNSSENAEKCDLRSSL